MKKKWLVCLVMGISLMMNSVTLCALPKDVYQEWQKRYMDTVDTVLSVKLVSEDGAVFCGVRSMIWLPCYCSVFYEVLTIERKPETLNLKVGDQLSLKYRCDKNKRYVGNDATLPWMTSSTEAGVMSLHFRSSYLKNKKKSQWSIDNSDKVFYPFAHNKVNA